MNATEEMAPVAGPGFAIRMPGETTWATRNEDTDQGEVSVLVYSSGSELDAYSVSTSTELVGDMAAYLGSLTGPIKGRVSSAIPTAVQGYEACDARLDGRRGNTPVVALLRVVATDTSTVTLQYVVEGADVAAPPPAFLAMVGSLQLT